MTSSPDPYITGSRKRDKGHTGLHVNLGAENLISLVSALNGGTRGYRLCVVHLHAPHLATPATGALRLLVALTVAREVSVHVGGRGRQASPPHPVTPPTRLGAGGPGPPPPVAPHARWSRSPGSRRWR
jgi:hypothetical protein